MDLAKKAGQKTGFFVSMQTLLNAPLVEFRY